MQIREPYGNVSRMEITEAALEWARTLQRITRRELTAEQGRKINGRLRAATGEQWPLVHAKAITMLADRHGA